MKKFNYDDNDLIAQTHKKLINLMFFGIALLHLKMQQIVLQIKVYSLIFLINILPFDKFTRKNFTKITSQIQIRVRLFRMLCD